MKIYAIRDDEQRPTEELGYLFYYEGDQAFYIELRSEISPERMPFILRDKAEEGCYTLGSAWSRTWVEQRVIPPERQNLGAILREHQMEEYDEYRMLMLANGRCEQDHCYLSPVKEADLPEEIRMRRGKNIAEAYEIGNSAYLVFLEDGTALRTDAAALLQSFEPEAVYRRLMAYRKQLSFIPRQGGYEAEIADSVFLSAERIRGSSVQIPLSHAEFRSALELSLVDTAEAASMLKCSRQYIQQCVKRGALSPVRSFQKDAVFLREEIERMKK